MPKLILILLIACLAGGFSPNRVFADENGFEGVFKDGIYGGLAGALVGGATLAFQDHPSDHLNYITYGAAIGVFVGVTLGLVKTGRAMAELDNQRLVFNLPTPEIRSAPGTRELTASIDLVKIRF